MFKKLTIAEFEKNMVNELDLIGQNNYIIIKRPKGNLIILSQIEFNSIQETFYLLSSTNNKKHLLDSIQEFKDGKGIKFKLEDIWK
jgi:PHD/YefM family antitoxin component YafN of YafNO toxin-antitoxin module